MLYACGFEQLCIAVADLYLDDPDADQGAEQGVRLELRRLERGTSASIFAAAPIVLDRPLWRADLLESVSNPGSFDRVHHHTRFVGWEPDDREFDAALSADPVGWVEARLAHLDQLLNDLGVSDDDPARRDVSAVSIAAPEIARAIRQMLDGVRSGRLAQPCEPLAAGGAHLGWL